MFEKPQTIRLAAYFGIVAALAYLILGAGATGGVRTFDPFQPVNWDLQMQATAARFPGHFFLGGLLVLIHLFAAFFFLALAQRAYCMHPTSAAMAGGLLLAAVATGMLQRIWQVFGAELAAVRYVSLGEGSELRAALQHAYQLSSAIDGFLIAVAVSFSIPGFALMAYALRHLAGMGRVLMPAFLLASATQFLAILAVGYAFNVGRVEHAFSRLTLGLAAIGAWALPVVATALGAFWLLGQTAPPEEKIREVPIRKAA